jgi:23S rRNA pseudouridine2605 synthase/23S rRNA pseudouridine2604 synthase
MLERLQKILSARGIASRRKAEEYIERGLVKVNGKVVKVGDKADPEVDRIEVDGKVMEARQEMLYYVLYKPVGVVTTNAEGGEQIKVEGQKRGRSEGQNGRGAERREDRKTEGRDRTIPDLLPAHIKTKVYPVGRLDKDSEGLLLLTNDGVLAYRLTHPKFNHQKEYEVTTTTEATDGQIRKMAYGLKIDGEKTKPVQIKRLGKNKFSVVLTEGRNRQIRRMCQKVGLEVLRLVRIRIMTLTDSALQPGSVRALDAMERQELLQAVGI